MSSERDRAPFARGARSETVTVRLDPKLRYFAEIAARKHRRTLSSFIEWAIEQSLGRVILSEPPDSEGPSTIADELHDLWDVDEPDRFIKLAFRHPELLTHEEQVLWKLLRENGLIWRGRYDSQTSEWTWAVNGPSDVVEENLRKYWDSFRAVAEGRQPRASLPSWQKTRLATSSKSGSSKDKSDNDDDEIPF
jgi:hypothetical protein